MKPFLRGVVAGAASLAASALGRWAGVLIFFPELMSIRLFELIPMGAFEFFVRRLGSWSKWVALLGTVCLALLGAGLAGLVVGSLPRGWRPLQRAAASACGLTALFTFVLLPLLGSDLLGKAIYPTPSLPAPIALFVVAAVYSVAFEGVGRGPLSWRAAQGWLTRRRP